MRVVDFDRTYQANSIQELEAVLTTRHEGNVNSFWLYPDSEEFPQLGLLIKNELASLSYLPQPGTAGFSSVGPLATDLPGETTLFPISKYRADDLYVRNEAVLPLSAALVAAKEFFVSNDLPQSVEWFEL